MAPVPISPFAIGLCSLPAEIIDEIASYFTCQEATNHGLVFGTTALPQTDVPPDAVALSLTCSYLRRCLARRVAAGAVVDTCGTFLANIANTILRFRPHTFPIHEGVQAAALALSPDTQLRRKRHTYIQHLRLQGKSMTQRYPRELGMLHQLVFDWFAQDVPPRLETLSWNVGAWHAIFTPCWFRSVGAHLRTLVLEDVDFDVLQLVELPMVKSFEISGGHGTLENFEATLQRMPGMVELRIHRCKIDGFGDDDSLSLSEALWKRLEVLHIDVFEVINFGPDTDYGYLPLRELHLTRMRLGADDLSDFASVTYMPHLKTLSVDVYDTLDPAIFGVMAEGWPNIERLSLYAMCEVWDVWDESNRENKTRWFRNWDWTDDVSSWHRALSEFRRLKEFRHNNDPQDPTSPGATRLGQMTMGGHPLGWLGNMDTDETGSGELEAQEESEDREGLEEMEEEESGDEESDLEEEDLAGPRGVLCRPSQSFQKVWNQFLRADRDLEIGYSFSYPKACQWLGAQT